MAQNITKARAQLIRKYRAQLRTQTKKNFNWEMFLKMKALLMKHKQEAAWKKLLPTNFDERAFGLRLDRYAEYLRLKRSYHADLRIINRKKSKP